MIIQFSGKVKYLITLDASVWIFDDRKLTLDEAFSDNSQEKEPVDELKKTAERFSVEVYQQKIKPPVNKSINKYEREQILVNTYVMPIYDFVENAEVDSDVTEAILTTTNGPVEVPIDKFKSSLLLFSENGKPVKEDGPVHLYFDDASNKDNPIKGISKITFN